MAYFKAVEIDEYVSFLYPDGTFADTYPKNFRYAKAIRSIDPMNDCQLTIKSVPNYDRFDISVFRHYSHEIEYDVYYMMHNNRIVNVFGRLIHNSIWVIKDFLIDVYIPTLIAENGIEDDKDVAGFRNSARLPY